MQMTPHTISGRLQSAPAEHHPDRRIAVAEVRSLCGGISAMTVHRWLNSPTLEFPKPIYIGPRRYWKEADILAWLESRQEVAHATA